MTGKVLQLQLQAARSAPHRENVAVKQAVIAGWTGRDAAAVEKHIKELEVLGVKRPAATPIFYRCAASLLTTDASIEVLGTASSGEVEFVLLRHGGKHWVGTGSDHTDREVEAYGVSVSKQMCAKPIAPAFWAFDDVAAHWDKLVLRSFAVEGDKRALYQEGSVAAMRAPDDLLARFGQEGDFADGSLMFCGTLAVHGGVRAAPRFAFELEDPVLGRKIAHGYDVVSLPIRG